MTIRVLLVDDVVDVRRLLRTALRFRGGFEVVGEASDGGEAVQLAESLRPDLVVLDLGLPDIAGREVLSRIREQVARSPRWSSSPARTRRTGPGSPATSRATCSRTPSSTTWWTCWSPSGRRRENETTLDLPQALTSVAAARTVRPEDGDRLGPRARCSTTRCWWPASSPPTR